MHKASEKMAQLLKEAWNMMWIMCNNSPERRRRRSATEIDHLPSIIVLLIHQNSSRNRWKFKCLQQPISQDIHSHLFFATAFSMISRRWFFAWVCKSYKSFMALTPRKSKGRPQVIIKSFRHRFLPTSAPFHKMATNGWNSHNFAIWDS